MTSKNEIHFKVKRVYETPQGSDACRILVDRLWPRGLAKEAAELDGWVKDVAPSTELRKWFGHEPSKWESFKHRYFDELKQQEDVRGQLLCNCTRSTVTLLFAAKDTEHNHALALKEYLDKQLESQG